MTPRQRDFIAAGIGTELRPGRFVVAPKVLRALYAGMMFPDEIAACEMNSHALVHGSREFDYEGSPDAAREIVIAYLKRNKPVLERPVPFMIDWGSPHLDAYLTGLAQSKEIKSGDSDVLRRALMHISVPGSIILPPSTDTSGTYDFGMFIKEYERLIIVRSKPVRERAKALLAAGFASVLQYLEDINAQRQDREELRNDVLSAMGLQEGFEGAARFWLMALQPGFNKEAAKSTFSGEISDQMYFANAVYRAARGHAAKFIELNNLLEACATSAGSLFVAAEEEAKETLTALNRYIGNRN